MQRSGGRPTVSLGWPGSIAPNAGSEARTVGVEPGATATRRPAGRPIPTLQEGARRPNREPDAFPMTQDYMAQVPMVRAVTEADERERGEYVRTSVVLPAYNERESVGTLIEEIVDVCSSADDVQLSPFEIIVVDDGSTDGTREELQELADAVPELTVIVLTRNFGQSAALAAGIERAVGDWIVTLDADGQNDPRDIARLVGTLEEGYDCVSGWRKDRNDPLRKRIPSALQTRLAMLTGPEIHDFGCTLKAYRREVLQEIDLFGEGHRYIPAMLYKQGYRITEQVVNHRPRTEGNTKYGTNRLVKGFVDLLFQVFWNRYSTRPLHFLGAVGFVMMAIGGTIGFHAVLLKYMFGVPLVPMTPRLILTAALLIFGLQLLIFGFFAEILIKFYYKEDDPYRIDSVIE